eukprot:8015125-Pyramimonas_sp.AAC.1
MNFPCARIIQIAPPLSPRHVYWHKPLLRGCCSSPWLGSARVLARLDCAGLRPVPPIWVALDGDDDDDDDDVDDDEDADDADVA